MVGGCSATDTFPAAYHGGTEVAPLPSLSADQMARDSVARSDAAVLDRAEELVGLASNCDKCAGALEKTATAAAERLDLSGGVWEPWGVFAEQEDAALYVELPAEVGEAPYTVQGLIGYMATTATAQLVEVAETEGMEPGVRANLAGVLGARLVSAYDLAQAFNTTVPEAIKALPDGGAAPRAGTDADLDESGAPVDPVEQVEHPLQSGADQDMRWEALLDASGAVVGFDCLRSTLLMNSDGVLPPERVLALSDTLERRNQQILRTGVEDTRPLRCLLAPSDTATYVREMIRFDLALIMDGNQEARVLAAKYLAADIPLWLEFEKEPLPTDTLLSTFEGFQRPLSDGAQSGGQQSEG